MKELRKSTKNGQQISKPRIDSGKYLMRRRNAKLWQHTVTAGNWCVIRTIAVGKSHAKWQSLLLHSHPPCFVGQSIEPHWSISGITCVSRWDMRSPEQKPPLLINIALEYAQLCACISWKKRSFVFTGRYYNLYTQEVKNRVTGFKDV